MHVDIFVDFAQIYHFLKFNSGAVPQLGGDLLEYNFKHVEYPRNSRRLFHTFIGHYKRPTVYPLLHGSNI